MKDESAAIPASPVPSRRVSVAICTYNGQKFVRAQLESIAGQSQPVDEIVICDDGSTDGTQDVVRSFAAASAVPVRFGVNASRLGVTKNFENAISRCTGDILFLSDQDDVWHPDKVRHVTARFADPAVGLVFSNARVVCEDLSPAGYSMWDSVWFTPDEREQVRAGRAVPVLLRHAIAAGSTLAFRAAYLPLVLPIPDVPNSHDIWITLLIACVARLDPVDEPLVQYRLHASNTIGLRRYDVLGQIKMARWQLRTRQFLINANLHQAALERLETWKDEGATSPSGSSFTLHPSTLALLREKVAHYRARDRMPGFWPSRVPVVAREFARGHYGKYSYGLKSVLQDLFLR
jgi:glycosyltransferase involved in cell wall biosynthesis